MELNARIRDTYLCAAARRLGCTGHRRGSGGVNAHARVHGVDGHALGGGGGGCGGCVDCVVEDGVAGGRADLARRVEGGGVATRAWGPVRKRTEAMFSVYPQIPVGKGASNTANEKWGVCSRLANAA